MNARLLHGRLVHASLWQTAIALALSAWPALGAVQPPPDLQNPAPIARAAPATQVQGGADFFGTVPSAAARRVADWVVNSGDNQGLPFVIIDKIGAKVYVFDRQGRLRGATFALLGAAIGDDSAPDIGTLKLSQITPADRTTPAGRFVARLGRDFQHDVLWIDYGKALSLHRVVHGNPGDHRLQRLATNSTLDKRISYGCINVPAKFYDQVVLGTFTGTDGIVYILPEVKTIEEVFPGITGT